MKDSGFIRRINDFGNIIIPRDIRRMCGIRNGDPLKIYYDEKAQTITLKRHKTEEELREEWIDRWHIEFLSSVAFSKRVGNITIVAWNGRIEIARCRHEDTYNRRVGEAICMAKLCGERIPEYI